MPVNPRLLPFTQHFIELRKRFTRVIVVLVVLTLIFYSNYFYKPILDLFFGPVKDFLPGGKVTIIGPFEALTFRFKIALFAGLIATMPYIMYNVMAFLIPAFKERERKWLVPTVLVAVGLFLGGAGFAYFFVLGPAFQWLSAQGGDAVNVIAAADLYFSGISLMLIGFGIGFELPLVTFYLIGWGVLSFDAIMGGWRYAVVGILIVASIATPDWSPISMGGLALALLALYFVSLGIARFVFAKKINQQRKDKEEYDALYAQPEEDDELDLPDNFDQLSRKEQLIARAAAERRRQNRNTAEKD